MPATIDYEPNDICVLNVSGTWKRSEMDALQDELAHKIVAGARPRLLAVLQDFEGWEKNVDWNEFDFLFAYSDKVQRIAIVAERQWEVQALAFAGAGVRPARVRFFLPDEIQPARAWLAE